MISIRIAFLFAAVFSFAALGHSQSAASERLPDVLVFTNGDQLSGKIVRAVSGNVVFKSEMAGELTISFDKIKELRSGSETSQFAMLPKHVPAKQQQSRTPEGTLAYADGRVTITPSSAPPVSMQPADIAYLINKSAYDKAIAHRAGVFTGWTGAVTGGATLVRSSQVGTTLTAAVALVRAIPIVPYLPARNRTLVNIAESYGTLTTIAPPPPSEAVKTSIFHGDFERDEYFSSRLYALGDASFDHNFAQLLQLQQIYGGGLGWTAIKSDKQELDVKVDAHYEREQFLAPVPPAASAPAAPSISLFGSTFSENYTRTFPRKIVLTESGSYIPSWTTLDAYSANFAAALAAPVFKNLSVSLSTIDGYLNNAPTGTRRNSFQFITGVTYNLR